MTEQIADGVFVETTEAGIGNERYREPTTHMAGRTALVAVSQEKTVPWEELVVPCGD